MDFVSKMGKTSSRNPPITKEKPRLSAKLCNKHKK